MHMAAAFLLTLTLIGVSVALCAYSIRAHIRCRHSSRDTRKSVVFLGLAIVSAASTLLACAAVLMIESGSMPSADIFVLGNKLLLIVFTITCTWLVKDGS